MPLVLNQQCLSQRGGVSMPVLKHEAIDCPWGEDPQRQLIAKEEAGHVAIQLSMGSENSYKASLGGRESES